MCDEIEVKWSLLGVIKRKSQYVAFSMGAVRGVDIPDSKVHGANMGPTWVLLVADGTHVGPMNLANRDDSVTQGVPS